MPQMDSFTPTTGYFTFRKFQFRSQSLRFKRSASTSSPLPNSVPTQKSTSLRQKSSALSFNKLLSRNNGSNQCISLCQLSLRKDGGYLIINSLPHSPESSSSSDLVKSPKPITPPIQKQQLTRHQSIKSFYRSSSNQSLIQSQTLSQQNLLANNFIIGNAPPTSLIDMFENNNNPTFDHDDIDVEENYHFEDDEGVVTHEDDDDSDLDEVEHPESLIITTQSSKPKSTITTTSFYRKVNIYRHPRLGLGISIVGGCDMGQPVTIVAIKENSPAERIGDIFIGDQIISVNEVPFNEDTSHQDALKLLSKCGIRVTLLLKHSKAVTSFSKKWKHQHFSISNIVYSMASAKTASTSKSKNNDHRIQMNHSFSKIANRNLSLALNTKDFPNQEDDDDNKKVLRINLLLSGISQYIAYSDKIRDAGFELQYINDDEQNSLRSIVVHCLSKDVSLKWYHVIKRQIHKLTDSFMKNFNKHFPRNEHFLYMGFVSELVTMANQHSTMSTSLLSMLSPMMKPMPSSMAAQRQHRWLSRYLIVKGGKVYVFKVPPTSILLNYKRKISFMFHNLKHHRHNHQNNGSSLGSVAGVSNSSCSDESSEPSTAASTPQLLKNDSNSNVFCDNSTIVRANSVKPDRLLKVNRCLENELELLCLDRWICYNSDFGPIKPSQQTDEKGDCFMIYSGKTLISQRYFSTECRCDLDRLKEAWNVANYNSVIKNDSKIYTVTLEKENYYIVGSLKIDWQNGFSFYDAQRNDCLWSYRFHQLKQSSDDGNDLLSLTFVIDPSDSRVTEAHLLRCSCLQTIIFCIHAFLKAKVYSLYL